MAILSHGKSLPLSVVIPAYNEAERILPYLGAISKYLEHRSLAGEVLVVDDGSTDQTATVVRQFAGDAPLVRLLRLERNVGKGGAVRTGVRAAQGKLILIADADGATPINEIERLEAEIVRGAQLAIGSRYLASRDPRYRVEARWHRSMLGDLFNWTIHWLGLRGIMDTQCGFKLFRKEVAGDLFSVARIDRYGFDLEILYVAQRRGYRISEVPVNWTDQPGSKVRVFRDGGRMLADMLRVRRNHSQGFYEARPMDSASASA